MRTSHLCYWKICALICTVAACDLQAATLYGVDTTDQLFSIDTNTAAFNWIGELPAPPVGGNTGLGTGSTGTLYMTQHNASDDFSTLWQVNPGNAAASFIANSQSYFQSLEVVNDVGYGVDDGILRAVNLANGAESDVGPVSSTQTFINYGGLAYGNGVLYAFGRYLDEDFGRLISIDLATGSQLDTLATGSLLSMPAGFAFADGSLWGIRGGELLRFDWAAAQWSTVFSGLPVQSATGLTAAIPAPGALGVFFLFATISSRRRRPTHRVG